MADQATSLPVRTEADPDQRLQSKIIDFTVPGQGMEVDSDNNAHVEIHGNRVDDGSDAVVALSETGRVNGDGAYDSTTNSKPASAGLIAHERASADGLAEVSTFTALAAASLSGGEYFTFHDGTTAYYAWLTVDAAGSDPAPGGTGIVVALLGADTADQVATKVRAAIAGSAALVTPSGATDQIIVTNDNVGDVTDATAGTSGFGLVFTDGAAAGLPDVNLNKRVTAVTNGTTTALDVALHDENGEAFSASNPIPVQPLPLSGTRVHDYQGGEVVKDATDNHDYTVSGSPLNLYEVLFASSGRGRFVLQVDPDGISGFSTIAVGYTSTSVQSSALYFDGVPVQVAVGGIVRVARTNQDKDDMDMHSTLVGILN